MPRTTIARIAALLVLCSLAFVATSAKCIEHDKMYVDSEGYTHVVGLVTNETDISASTMTLQAKLFDAANNVVAETTGLLCPEAIQPTSQNVFDLRFPNPNVPNVVRHEVRPISGKTLVGPLPPSEVFLIRFYAERVGPGVVVVGQVRNDSGRNYFDTALCAGFYDNKGDVIRVLSHPIEGILTPGQALIFTGGLEDVPPEAVQFQLWFSVGPDFQWVNSTKITIQ